MQRCALPVILRLVPGMIAIAAVPPAPAASSTLEQQFAQTVRPFVTRYCIGCHSGDTPAAQFDLKAYTTMEMVVRDHPRWALVAEKLAAQQMPPAPIPQPPAESRQQVIDWIKAMRSNEARKNAGDPGVVLARRLSNSEYNYTIRDLTGVDIRPTREFPVDPANPAGFDNSGESLTMSPALLKKYLDAAREVGDHMVLTPDGFDFASHPMLVETDRDRYTIQRIVDFYARQPTDYADYFQAAWRFKYRSILGKPGATLAATAADAKVSAKISAHDLAASRGTAGGGQTGGGPDRQASGPVARSARAGKRPDGPGGRPRAMCRDARLRGPDPQPHGHAIRGAGSERIARRFAAPAELEAPPVQFPPQEFRPRRSAQRHRPASGGA
jgi:hypothetical protein